MRLRFFKMSGAGNDFVLLDGKGGPALARKLCDRREGVGADGLLSVSARGSGFRLDYFNADGSAAFCGNGTRCAAWWLRKSGRAGKSFSLTTDGNSIPVRIIGKELVAIGMPEPKGARLGLRLGALGRSWTAHFIDSGVPHAVVEVEDLEAAPVLELGRALRRHAAFAPAGANVDFIAKEPGRWGMRTYERGVEGETLACGTGAAASALILSLLGKAKSPVKIRVRSGGVLAVQFDKTGGAFKNIWLEGPARIVYEGEIKA